MEELPGKRENLVVRRMICAFHSHDALCQRGFVFFQIMPEFLLSRSRTDQQNLFETLHAQSKGVKEFFHIVLFPILIVPLRSALDLFRQWFLIHQQTKHFRLLMTNPNYRCTHKKSPFFVCKRIASCMPSICLNKAFFIPKRELFSPLRRRNVPRHPSRNERYRVRAGKIAIHVKRFFQKTLRNQAFLTWSRSYLIQPRIPDFFYLPNSSSHFTEFRYVPREIYLCRPFKKQACWPP